MLDWQPYCDVCVISCTEMNSSGRRKILFEEYDEVNDLFLFSARGLHNFSNGFTSNRRYMTPCCTVLPWKLGFQTYISLYSSTSQRKEEEIFVFAVSFFIKSLAD